MIQLTVINYGYMHNSTAIFRTHAEMFAYVLKHYKLSDDSLLSLARTNIFENELHLLFYEVVA